MEIVLPIHIAAGGLALVTGFVALFVAKGMGVHRGSGMIFVFAMLVMGTTATWISAAQGEGGAGALLVVYLAVTALTTVRPPTAGSRRLDAGMMLLGLALGVYLLLGGIEALGMPGMASDGVPAAMILLLAGVALAGGAGDLRVLRAGPPRGGRRLARHLWRMCFALYMASGSFFLGQADELPEPLRILPLLAIAAVLPLLVMPYWLWRVRRPASRPEPRLARGLT